MSEESVWSGLGSNVLGGNRVEELKALVQDIHREMVGSVEALGRRVYSIETSMTDLDAKMNLLIKAVDRLEALPTAAQYQAPVAQESGEIENVLMVMSPEELGIARTKEEEEIVDDGVEVISVKGFVAPPPEREETSVEPTTDVEDGADAIYKFIEENGGTLSNHWKTRNLIHRDTDKKTRDAIREVLIQRGVKTYRVNKFKEWMFIGDEDPQKHYEQHA
tara:strand:+ start:19603 stop:20262 length:660 start_codon:yes stop_codon:yes gene_type:complete